MTPDLTTNRSYIRPKNEMIDVMRLTLHTDYALRVLVYVGARGGELVTISEIAESHGISKNHLTKVVHQLGRGGFLETVRGKYGGIRLLVEPQSLRLGDFIRRVEEDFTVVRCLRDQGDHQCRIGATCLARDAFRQGVQAFFDSLNGVTLADMIAAELRGQLLAVSSISRAAPWA